MKNLALYSVAFTCALSVNCFAQNTIISAKGDDMASLMADNQLAVVSYHVEERINMNFGSRITTYDVPTLNLISTKDLGENNTRVVTPKYGKVRTKIQSLAVAKNSKPKFNNVEISIQPINTDIVATFQRKPQYAEIDVVATYERVMDKGYKSVVMITKVADRHFFDGDYGLAAKWYTELFNNGTDNLEAVYYYRYAQSLIETGQKAKGNEMMKIFETKSL